MIYEKTTKKSYSGKRVLYRQISRSQWLCLLLVFTLLVFLFSSLMFFHAYLSTRAEAQAFDNLAELAGRGEEAADQNTVSTPAPSAADDTMANLLYLHDQNPDFCGWLSIEGTHINYPVMRTPEDPEYYLHHDFEKNESASGVPFVGEGCGLDSDNIIVFSHNMKNGTMFADLLKYGEEEFLREHPVITLDTLDGSAEYEIMGVLRDKVHFQDEKDVFRYYQYGGELTEERFNEYVSNVLTHSLFDTGITAQYGDQLLTLSTCSYHTANGRFAVVAKKR